jgi:transcriptional regulator with XRE-family HTH domain
MSPMEKLAAYVSARRKELSLSQAEVAEKIHYTIQALSKFENNRGSLALSCLPDLADALGVDVDSLLTYQDKKDPTIPAKKELDLALLAKNLTTARLQKGFSQKEAADHLLLSKGSLINYEKGRSYPSIETFYWMIEVYEKKPSELFYGSLREETSQKKKSHRGLGFSLLGLLVLAGVLAATLPFLPKKTTTDALPIDTLVGVSLSLKDLQEENGAYNVVSGTSYDVGLTFSPADWLSQDPSRSQYLSLKKKEGADIYLPEQSNYATLTVASLKGPLEESLYLVCHDEKRVDEVYSNVIKLRIL